jgi:hypothetical protein
MCRIASIGVLNEVWIFWNNNRSSKGDGIFCVFQEQLGVKQSCKELRKKNGMDSVNNCIKSGLDSVKCIFLAGVRHIPFESSQNLFPCLQQL